MGAPISKPNLTIQLLEAGLVDALADRRDLIVGQNGAAGSAADKVLVTDVQNLTDDQIRAQFGTGELYYRIQNWRAGNGGYSPLDVIPADANGGGVAATATIVASGTATANGTITVSVIDERQFSVQVVISSGDDANAIAAAINAALNTITRKPFTNAVATNTVTLTAADVGTIGNTYGHKISGNVAGVTLTTTAWGSGATDASFTDIFDSIDGRRYTGINWPDYLSANAIIVVDLLTPRFNTASAVMDGVAFMGRSFTFADFNTYLQDYNSQIFVVMGNNVIDTGDQKGPAILQPAPWISAYFQGVRARRLTPGAPIADFVIATGGRLDAVGGPALASKPYFNTPLANTQVTLPQNQYSLLEQQSLESAGGTVYGVNPAGTGMVMNDVVTTRTTDAAGNVNDSFHFLNYIDSGSACREIYFNTLRATYAQSRLTEGDLVPGYDVQNADSIKSELLRIYRILAQQALTQAGREAESFYSQNTQVVVNLSARSVSINGPLPIVTQFGEATYPLQLAFTVGQSGTQVNF